MTLVAAIAIYAAILSTIMAVRTFWIERDRLKVVLVHGARTDVPGGAVVVDIRNHGRRAAYVSQVGFVVETKRLGLFAKIRRAVKYRSLQSKTEGWLHILAPSWADAISYPVTIEPGGSLQLWAARAELERSSEGRRFIAEVQDGLRRRSYSGWFQFGR